MIPYYIIGFMKKERKSQTAFCSIPIHFAVQYKGIL